MFDKIFFKKPYNQSYRFKVDDSGPTSKQGTLTITHILLFFLGFTLVFGVNFIKSFKRVADFTCTCDSKDCFCIYFYINNCLIAK